MGLKVEDIIRSRISKNASRCHFEQNFLVMKTGLLALAKETMKEEMGRKPANVRRSNPIKFLNMARISTLSTNRCAHCTSQTWIV
jgi:intracellular multiplication protein IcmB